MTQDMITVKRRITATEQEQHAMKMTNLFYREYELELTPYLQKKLLPRCDPEKTLFLCRVFEKDFVVLTAVYTVHRQQIRYSIHLSTDDEHLLYRITDIYERSLS